MNAVATHFPPSSLPANRATASREAANRDAAKREAAKREAASREAASRAQRHSRAELEAMASRFVLEGPQPASVRRHLPRAPFAAALAVTVAGALAWAWWPAGGLPGTAERPMARMKTAAALPEDAASIRQRLQAERERSRREARSGAAYLERMAAADAATVAPTSPTAPGPAR